MVCARKHTHTRFFYFLHADGDNVEGGVNVRPNQTLDHGVVSAHIRPPETECVGVRGWEGGKNTQQVRRAYGPDASMCASNFSALETFVELPFLLNPSISALYVTTLGLTPDFSIEYIISRASSQRWCLDSPSMMVVNVTTSACIRTKQE